MEQLPALCGIDIFRGFLCATFTKSVIGKIRSAVNDDFLAHKNSSPDFCFPRMDCNRFISGILSATDRLGFVPAYLAVARNPV